MGKRAQQRGSLHMRVDALDGGVRMKGVPVDLTLDPDEARELAVLLNAAADSAEGVAILDPNPNRVVGGGHP